MKSLSQEEAEVLLENLHLRFEKNKNRHQAINWNDVEMKLRENPEKLWSLNQMEITGGEPYVIGFDKDRNEYLFCDCSAESPKERRSICYDPEALASRKEHKPKDSAVGMATKMGVELLTEQHYFELQKVGTFDTKTSSWLATPEDVRNLGGAIFGDYRYGRVFIYHNGAESYYGARGFRSLLKL